MSEKTPEQAAAERQLAIAAEQARKDAIAARVTELKSYEGKLFMSKDGSGFPVTIINYAGIGTKNGQSYHDFRVETLDSIHVVHATEFLANFVEVQPTATEAKKEVI